MSKNLKTFGTAALCAGLAVVASGAVIGNASAADTFKYGSYEFTDGSSVEDLEACYSVLNGLNGKTYDSDKYVEEVTLSNPVVYGGKEADKDPWKGLNRVLYTTERQASIAANRIKNKLSSDEDCMKGIAKLRKQAGYDEDANYIKIFVEPAFYYGSNAEAAKGLAENKTDFFSISGWENEVKSNKYQVMFGYEYKDAEDENKEKLALYGDEITYTVNFVTPLESNGIMLYVGKDTTINNRSGFKVIKNTNAETVQSALDGKEVIVSYDLELEANTIADQTKVISDGVEVLIPIELTAAQNTYYEDGSKTVAVYYIEDGAAQGLVTTVVDKLGQKYAKFTANHFSTYAVALVNSNEAPTTNPEEGIGGGDNTGTGTGTGSNENTENTDGEEDVKAPNTGFFASLFGKDGVSAELAIVIALAGIALAAAPVAYLARRRAHRIR